MVEAGEATQSNQPPSKDACTWAMLCHIAGLAWLVVWFIGGIIGAIIVWQTKRDLHPFVDLNGKEAINFQISMLIYFAIALLLCFTWVLVPIIAVADVVLALIAAVNAAEGQMYRYPLAIRFVK